MKSIKYLVVLVCMTLGLANVAKAQIYSNEILFYQRTDKDDIVIVKFDGGNKRVFIAQLGKQKVQKVLKESINRFEDDEVWEPKYHLRTGGWVPRLRNYDYELSNSSKEVYKGITDTEIHRLYGFNDPSDVGRRYAFSKDLSSLVFFHLDIMKPVYYIRVNKEDLLPQALNPHEIDFLNE